MILVTTALEGTFGVDDDLLLLGDWCQIYEKKNSFVNRNFVVLPYHWDDREKLEKDYYYLQKINSALMPHLTKTLNDLHNVNHSLRYWHLLLGYWLTQFTSVVFDRWTMIQKAIRHSNIKTIIIQMPHESMVANDVADASDLFLQDNWNHDLCAKLIENWTDISVDYIPHQGSDKTLFLNKPKKNLVFNCKLIVQKFLHKVSYACNLNSNYLLVETGLSKKNEARILLKLRNLPSYWCLPKTQPYSYDSNYRKWWINNHTSSLFEEIVQKLVPLYLPKIFVEGYADAVKKINTYRFPRNVKKIFTAYSHYNSMFNLWAGERVECGANLIVGQHGGGVFPKFNGAHAYDLTVCDTYLSTGNGNNFYPHVKDIGRFNHKIQIDKWSSSGHALLVTLASSRYCFEARSMVIGGQILQYLNDQYCFFRGLPKNIQDKLMVRLYNYDNAWSQKNRWLDEFPNVNFDECNQALSKAIKNARIVIATYAATTYNESLAANIPTIIFWDSTRWELCESSMPYFDDLRSVGIFHDSPESAAHQLIKVWECVTDWWSDSKLQRVRENFCRRYAYLPNNMLDLLTDVIRVKSDES